MDRIPIDKLNLEAYITDNPPAFGVRVRQGPLVVLTPEDGRDVRDALTDWLDELEDEAR